MGKHRHRSRSRSSHRRKRSRRSQSGGDSREKSRSTRSPTPDLAQILEILKRQEARLKAIETACEPGVPEKERSPSPIVEGDAVNPTDEPNLNGTGRQDKVERFCGQNRGCAPGLISRRPFPKGKERSYPTQSLHAQKYSC